MTERDYKALQSKLTELKEELHTYQLRLQEREETIRVLKFKIDQLLKKNVKVPYEGTIQ
jgi:hypothetical protein